MSSASVLERAVRELIKSCGCWIDSGTLLGIKREGDLLPGDEDIDLGIWISQIDKLGNYLGDEFNESDITKYYYDGVMTQCKIKRKNKRTIDIKIYRRKGSYAWSTSKVYLGDIDSNSVLYYTAGSLLYPLVFYFHNRKKRNDLSSKLSDIFWDVRTWWIPAKYYNNLDFDEEFDVYVPCEYENYLEYRYGDWETPDSSWVWYRDDGGLRNESPERIGLI